MAAEPTILVVDDDNEIRDSLRDVLQDAGYAVVTSADGAEALAYLRAHAAPALILLDWMMPRCDGSQFRAAQRSHPVLARIPVVLLTADARVEEKRRALAVDEALEKPVSLDRLLDVVARFCGG